MTYRSFTADSSGIKYRWATRGGNLPHGDPKLARLGVRQTPRAWAGYGGSEEITAEEEGLLGARIWETSSAAEAEAAAETAVVTAEDASIMTSIGEGAVLAFGWEFVLAAAAFTAVAAAVSYEIYENTGSRKNKRSPTSVLPEPSSKRQTTVSSWARNPKRHLEFDPLVSPDPKRSNPNPNQKTNPLAPLDDFSGLVTTFVNPVTSRIIGYKGIPRKHRYTALMATSPFWRTQMTPSRELFVSS